MSISMKDVRAWLDPDEVDYGKAKKLGPAAVPFLKELVQGGDLNLASKATYLASLIKSKQAAALVETAAARNEPVVRVAAASCIRNLTPTQAERLLDRLKNEPDAGIRKVAVTSAARLTSPRVAARLQQMAETDPEPFVRETAATVVKRLRRKRK